MYRISEEKHNSSQEFEIPTGKKLNPNNRWVILANLIPWQKFEGEYAALFDEKMGAPAKSFQMALGSLIIQEMLRFTDRETLEHIEENPYLQHFLGLQSYQDKAPFDASMLVYFRKRINREIIEKINKEIVLQALENSQEKKDLSKNKESEKERKNKGKLMSDASCIPSDISYPTDLNLLNKARKKTEKIIDKLYKPWKGKLEKKPRTDRKKARKEYLEVAKKKKVKRKKLRKALKRQLKYIQRNLGYIDDLIEKGSSLKLLTNIEYKELLVIGELLRQQWEMYEENKQSIPDRIVSINQPHIRPIVRGKAGKNVEFGAKILISYVDGYVFLDHVNWDNFNESKYLQLQIKRYYEYFGYYPESVHVDTIYRTRKNRKYCQEKGIRMSGPKLGRPKKNVSLEEKKQAYNDQVIRNKIEGKFGQGKRRFGLNLIMAKLKETSESKIAISVLVMNLMTLLSRVKRGFFWHFLCLQKNSVNFDKDKLLFVPNKIRIKYEYLRQWA